MGTPQETEEYRTFMLASEWSFNQGRWVRQRMDGILVELLPDGQFCSVKATLLGSPYFDKPFRFQTFEKAKEIAWKFFKGLRDSRPNPKDPTARHD
jgi:hypothetical protein